MWLMWPVICASAWTWKSESTLRLQTMPMTLVPKQQSQWKPWQTLSLQFLVLVRLFFLLSTNETKNVLLNHAANFISIVVHWHAVRPFVAMATSVRRSLVHGLRSVRSQSLDSIPMRCEFLQIIISCTALTVSTRKRRAKKTSHSAADYDVFFASLLLISKQKNEVNIKKRDKLDSPK